MIKKLTKNKHTMIINVFILMILTLGVTYALNIKTLGLNVTTALVAVDEEFYGGTVFDSSNIDFKPIIEEGSDGVDANQDNLENSLDNIIKIDFTVGGASTNNNSNIIYDIALNDLVLDCNLINKYIKWKLVKDGSVLTSGTLERGIENRRLVLTETQQDLPAYSATQSNYHNYTFYMWFSDSCQKSSISECTSAVDQSALLGKSFSGRIEVELYTESKSGYGPISERALSDTSACTYRLINEMEVGGYVKYVGNNGCIGESCNGQNANYVDANNKGYCSNSTNSYITDGWRIGYIEGGNAYLVSGGATDCICTNSEGTSSNSACSDDDFLLVDDFYKHIDELNEQALKYCNAEYAHGASCNLNSTWAMNANDFKKITTNLLDEESCYSESSSECGLNNSLIDNGGDYWYATQYGTNDSAFYWEPTSSLVSNAQSNKLHGVRPIIKLSSTVKVISGTGSYDDPYIITNNVNAEKTKVEKVTSDICKNVSYTGSSQTLIKQSALNTEGVTFENYTATDIGNYNVTASLNNGYVWKDGSITNVTITCPIKGAVIYMGNGGASSIYGSSMTETVQSGETYSIKENMFQKVGYTFSGWNTSVDGTGTDYTASIGTTNTWDRTENLTLYAQWTPYTYTISYNGNGSTSGTMVNSSHTYNVSSTLTANTYAKTGYVFDGWNTKSDGSGTSYSNQQSIINLATTSGETITLYAQWRGNFYTITYNGNGHTSGLMANSSHTVGIASNLRTNAFEKLGYEFVGWNTNAAGTGTSYNDGEQVLNLATENGTNVTLYAQWSSSVYTISYNGNGSTSGTMTNSTHEYGIASNLSTNSYSRTGYTFTGWNTQADGNGTSYTDAQEIEDLADESTGTITLYAQWRVNMIYIKYSANGGTVKTETKNTAGTITYNWSQDTNGIISKTQNGETTNLWHQFEYGDEFDSNGLTNYNNATFMSISKTGYLAASGYEWLCKSGNCSKTSYSQDTVYTLDELCDASVSDCTIILGVNWKANTYKIAYTLNSGTAGTNAPTTATYNSNVTISAPTRKHTITYNANSTGVTLSSTSATVTHTFDGWTSASGLNTSTAKYGTSTSAVTTSWSNASTKVKATYFKNLTATSGGTVNLTANWTKKSTTLPTITKTGYTCKWNTKSDGTGTNYNGGSSYTPDANVTLYARCTANKVIIKYSVNGGTIASTTSTASGTTTYTWTTDSSGVISRSANGGTASSTWHQAAYDSTTVNLGNYNNANFLNISKNGIGVEDGAEWICISGCTTANKRYDHDVNYKATDFCNATSASCTVTLGVNWNKLATATLVGNAYVWKVPRYHWESGHLKIWYYPAGGSQTYYNSGSSTFTNIKSNYHIGVTSPGSGATVYVEKTYSGSLTGIESFTKTDGTVRYWYKTWIQASNVSQEDASITSCNKVTIDGKVYYAVWWFYYPNIVNF